MFEGALYNMPKGQATRGIPIIMHCYIEDDILPSQSTYFGTSQWDIKHFNPPILRTQKCDLGHQNLDLPMITNVLWANNRIVSFQSKIIFFLENITFPNTRKSFYFPKSRFRKSADFKPINILNIQFLSILKSPDPLFSKKYVLKLRLPKQISQTYETCFFVFLRKLRKNVSPVVDGPQAEKNHIFQLF